MLRRPSILLAAVVFAAGCGDPTQPNSMVGEYTATTFLVTPDGQPSSNVLTQGGGLTLIRCGGHFAGGQVLHWAERRILFSGDIVQVIPDRRFVSFMYSYPNLIPLPPSKVEAIAAALEPYPFDTIIGAWWGRVVAGDGSGVVRRSAARYVRAVTEPGLPS